MVKKFVLALGAVFVLIGILGFIPAVTPNDQLFYLFEVDATHNVVHLLSGIVALAAVAAGGGYVRLYAQVFGLVYGLVAVLGFLGGDGTSVLGFLHVNTADNFLHLAISLSLLYAGYMPESRRSRG